MWERGMLAGIQQKIVFQIEKEDFRQFTDN